MQRGRLCIRLQTDDDLDDLAASRMRQSALTEVNSGISNIQLILQVIVTTLANTLRTRFGVLIFVDVSSHLIYRYSEYIAYSDI